MFEKILIPIDFSKFSKYALHCGIQLAEKCGAEVFVVHILNFLANIEQAAKGIAPGVNWLAAVGKDLKEFVAAEAYERQRLDVLANENVYSEILKYARHHNAELIVVGSHGRSDFVNTILGSTTQRLMRHSPIPVMVVPKTRNEGMPMKFQNLLVPIDFSDISIKALRLGIQMAQSWNSILHLIHVVDLDAYSEAQKSAGRALPELPETLDVSPTINSIVEKAEYKGSSKITTVLGDPGEEILRYAGEHDIDFIVMGSHGRKGLDRILIGSTATAVAKHSPVPIISICEQIPE